MTTSTRPTPQAVARWFLHGIVCCRAHQAGQGLDQLLHQHLCLGCDQPHAHTLRMRPLADQLTQRLRDR